MKLLVILFVLKFVINIDRIYHCLFRIYPIRRIYAWSITIQTYFMTFTMQQIYGIKDKITTFSLMFLTHFDIYKKNASTSSLIISFAYFFVITLECIRCSTSASLEEIKLTAIVNWIFHVLDFLKSFITFKYSLISSRYSFIDRVLFLSPLLSYLI